VGARYIMKIALSGNVHVIPEIMDVQERLIFLKHKVVPAFKYVDQVIESDEHRKKNDRSLFLRKIRNCDAILVLNNLEKQGRKNYISGCSFLEMGFAHALGKKIFLLDGIPNVSYKEEILAMKPIVLNGNLERIGNP
jgi:nucleoside 2-deoxyribosyltransferase